ncbi:MAG: hypothetical protein Q4G26_16560 [Paracoccus sp. (in: a-proteobacteria)]|nr:hypothetical protein [Paracoccus sp. (in: a-proteobacteria)]
MVRYLTEEEALAAAQFVASVLPWHEPDGYWYHKYISAYQMGCVLMEAIGYAKVSDWGAVPIDEPPLPRLLPRWDDAAVILLKLAEQDTFLGHRGRGNRSSEQQFLQALGLRDGDTWSDAAQPVLWRADLEGDVLPFRDQPLFLETVERSKRIIPEKIRRAVEAAGARRSRYSKHTAWQLDWIFNDNWRLGDGWLDEADAGRVLSVYYDPVAVAAREMIFGTV